MELLPIVVVVSLLGFFIILTTILFTWQYLRTRERRRTRQSVGSNTIPTRQLTLRSGRVIAKSDAEDTASTREPVSMDLPSPHPVYSAPCEADTRRGSEPQFRIPIYEPGHLPGLADVETPQHNDRRPITVAAESIPHKEQKRAPYNSSIPPSAVTERHGSLTVPRPSLVTIESRRPSATKSIESQSRMTSGPKVHTPQSRRPSTFPGPGSPPMSRSQSRKPSLSAGHEIADSLHKAYRGPGLARAETHDPSSSLGLWNVLTRTLEGRRRSEHSRSIQTSHSNGSRKSSKGRFSIPTLDTPMSSRVVSDSIQRPPPLFSTVDYSPHVRFAPLETDANRISFLSMTESADSSVASGQISPISPVIHAPPPSKVELAHYQESPPVTSEHGSIYRMESNALRDTPPQLDTPDFGSNSFFNSPASSEKSDRIQRGVSVMSNRSNFTIASSEISSNWTIGNAQVVNIYPSVAQERATPPHVRQLRSKYGRHPKGRRDKALPVLPKSPLSQTGFGAL